MVLPIALPLLLLPPTGLLGFVGMHKGSIPVDLTVICRAVAREISVFDASNVC